MIVQVEFPAAKLAPQVLVCAKSVGFAPVNPMLVIVNEPLPEGAVSVSVTGCEALVVPTFWLKVRAGARVPDVDGAMPVPVSVAGSGAASPAPLTDSVAEREPVAVGVNVMLIVQDEPAPGGGGKVAPQVPPAAPPGRVNTPAVVGEIGVIVMLITVSCTVPVLVNVSVCGALVVVSVWFGKAVGADRVTVGVTMLPVSATACAEPLPMFTFSVASLGFGVESPVGWNVTLIVQVAAGASAPQPTGVAWNCVEGGKR